MSYWCYTPENYEELNSNLREQIKLFPTGKQSQKQAVSHYDGYNHSKSININYPDFQRYRSYLTWHSPDALTGYLESAPQPIDESPDQRYKIIFWDSIAPLLHKFARDVAVRPETKLNYQIFVDMMWFHQMDKGDYDNWHNHVACQWIGVYYVDLPKGEETILIDYEGREFQPEVNEGQLLIFPAGYIHKSPDCNNRKTIVSFNFSVGSKYTIDIIEGVKKTHPLNFFDTTEGIKEFKE